VSFKGRIYRIALHGNPIAELESIHRQVGSHSVTCQLKQVNVPCRNHSRTGSHSIYLTKIERRGRVDLSTRYRPR